MVKVLIPPAVAEPAGVTIRGVTAVALRLHKLQRGLDSMSSLVDACSLDLGAAQLQLHGDGAVNALPWHRDCHCAFQAHARLIQMYWVAL